MSCNMSQQQLSLASNRSVGTIQKQIQPQTVLTSTTAALTNSTARETKKVALTNPKQTQAKRSSDFVIKWSVEYDTLGSQPSKKNSIKYSPDHTAAYKQSNVTMIRRKPSK